MERMKMCLIYKKIFFHGKNENVFNLQEDILSRNKQNADLNTLFYQYIVTSCRVYSIVKHRFSLFFIESVVFIFNKTTKLHLLTLFQKNCNYPTWTTWLCSFPNFLELFVTERTFLVQKTSLFFSDHIQKIKLGMQKMSDC